MCVLEEMSFFFLSFFVVCRETRISKRRRKGGLSA